MIPVDLPPDEQRALGTALHEAAHAVLAIALLGDVVELVTIDAGATFGGLTQWWSPLTAADHASLAEGPRNAGRDGYLRARGLCEADVMIVLAGPLAADLARRQVRWLSAVRLGELRQACAATVQRAPVLTRQVDALRVSDDQRSRAQASTPADTESDYRATGLTPGSDEAAAWAGVMALSPGHDPRVLGAHLEFLRADARALLEREWRAVEALAGALLEHGTLSGLAATLIVRRYLQ